MTAAWVTGKYPGGSIKTTGSAVLPFKHSPIIEVIHSTETDQIPVYPKGYEPHVTADPRRRIWQQHKPLTEAAYALKAPAGISTNTWGAIQVEVVGRAGSTMQTISDEDLAWLGGLLAMLADECGISKTSSVKSDGGAAYGLSGSVRLSRDAWYAYRGFLAHQNVPGNLHWDAGPIDWAKWMSAVNGGVVPVPNPVPQPTPPAQGAIAEDGWLGSGTIHEIQVQAGTVTDGELWYQYKGNAQPAFTSGWVYNYTKGKGSPAWAWVQGRLGTPQDGVFGQTDLRALEARAGYPYDHVLSGPSNTVKWLQHALNTHTL